MLIASSTSSRSGYRGRHYRWSGGTDGIQHPARRRTPSTLVTVSAGLALNHLGQALSLPADTDVAFVPQGEQLVVDAGLFAACEPPQTKDVPIGTGVYILNADPGFLVLKGERLWSGLSVQGSDQPYVWQQICS